MKGVKKRHTLTHTYTHTYTHLHTHLLDLRGVGGIVLTVGRLRETNMTIIR